MNNILLVDDDVAVTNYLMVFLMQTELYETTVINDSRQVPELLQQQHFDVILLDMNMPGLSGTDILKLTQEQGLRTPIVILTGFSDVDLAVKAMKLGAFDYLTKPVEDELLLEVLGKAIHHQTLHHSLSQLSPQLTKEDLAHGEAFNFLPTTDPAMIRLFHQIEKIAGSDLCIFIRGELGTPKEPLARAIHEAGPHRDGPFVAVDVAAQDPGRFAADFFGIARDWSGIREERTGFLCQAAGGTLFLDKIQQLSLPVQVRLLRMIHSKEYYIECSPQIRKIDVRVIAASRLDLSADEFRESFSQDLLHHLMINSIQIPPLRECRGDIPLLAQHFLEQERLKNGKPLTGFAPDFLEMLQKYDYPGNHQELRTIIAAAVVNEETATLTVNSLSAYMRDKLTGPARPPGPDFQPLTLAEAQRQHASRMLAHCGGDRERAGRELGISPEQLSGILGG